jgi:predicted RecB family endonuclease
MIMKQLATPPGLNVNDFILGIYPNSTLRGWRPLIMEPRVSPAAIHIQPRWGCFFKYLVYEL